MSPSILWKKGLKHLDDVDASFSSVDLFGLSILFCLSGGIFTSEKRCGDATPYWDWLTPLTDYLLAYGTQ